MKLRTPNRILFVNAAIRDEKGKIITQSQVAIKDYTGKRK